MAVSDDDGTGLPADPWLASVAAALEEAGHLGEIVDREWRLVYRTEASSTLGGFLVEPASDVAFSSVFMFGPEAMKAFASLPIGSIALDFMRPRLEHLGEWVIRDLEGGREQLRSLVDPRLEDIVDLIPETETSASAITYYYDGYGPAGSRPPMIVTGIRVHRPNGEVAGTAMIGKPALSMATLATLGAIGDREHLERLQGVAAAGRRPGAILFADLENSTPLAKKLSTAHYFALGRRLTRGADQCVVDAGGITGRHSGDGVVAFFLSENLGSESAAARACVRAARSLRDTTSSIAERSNLEPEDLTMRFGLHWGASLYVGLISTVGRTEVTALGDDVNDAARIEPCATGGRILASKSLVERLTVDGAADVGVDLDAITYTQLGDLPTATSKARRDAPSIAVCEL